MAGFGDADLLASEALDRDYAQLKERYPFLEEVILRAYSDYHLFRINERCVDRSILGVESRGSGCDSGYEYDWQYYAILGRSIHELWATQAPDFSQLSRNPTIREALASLPRAPDFIVGASCIHQKHYKGSRRDVELTVYRP